MAPTLNSEHFFDADQEDPGSPEWEGFGSDSGATEFEGFGADSPPSTVEPDTSNSLSLADRLRTLNDEQKLEYGADGTCDWCFKHIEIDETTNELVNPCSGPEFGRKWGCSTCREKQLTCSFAKRHDKKLKKIVLKASIEERLLDFGKAKSKLMSSDTKKRIQALGHKIKALQEEYEGLIASL
ncbi:hypothetical protein CALVIDRAFT_601674 [Calocera viscosa TUFC12733]|uniref:Uncharacterized protein n=1 Tax=Calocera viscosa (strain TUFC12733) TaxID=1330018 RepID=A0A167I009_CALVF|nr:hypothetical protein CALVIDRAFT_601674 [Calocera viscosa TUFC12733]